MFRPFDKNKIDINGVDRYYAANAGDTEYIESKLKEINADYIVLENLYDIIIEN